MSSRSPAPAANSTAPASTIAMTPMDHVVGIGSTRRGSELPSIGSYGCSETTLP